MLAQTIRCRVTAHCQNNLWCAIRVPTMLIWVQAAILTAVVQTAAVPTSVFFVSCFNFSFSFSL